MVMHFAQTCTFLQCLKSKLTPAVTHKFKQRPTYSTGHRIQLEMLGGPDRSNIGGNAAEWLGRTAQRGGGRGSLLAAAVSSDNRYLAVGGGDRTVHIWDARTGQHVQVRRLAALTGQKRRDNRAFLSSARVKMGLETC